MRTTKKIAISLPADLLKSAERARRARKQTRSEFLRHALESFLRAEAEKQDIGRYVQAYREQPETPEDITGIGALGRKVLSEEPWE